MLRVARDIVALGLAMAAGIAVPAWAGDATELVSARASGAPANGASGEIYGPAISARGRYVAFASQATNLVQGDTNQNLDVFVHDRRTGTTERVSLGLGGAQGNGASSDLDYPAISADGRYVAFSSDADNLVRGDTNEATDVFVRDRRTGITERVSLGRGRAQANGGSHGPVISADGRYVAFSSDADNLVRGDTNEATDVFVRDRWTGTTDRVSLGRGGAQGDDASGFYPGDVDISADGRLVAFASFASNLVQGDTNFEQNVFVRDRRTGRTEAVSLGKKFLTGSQPAISADGRYVAFFGGTEFVFGMGDVSVRGGVFVRDRRTGRAIRVDVGPGGGCDPTGEQLGGGGGEPSLSADGRFVAFSCDADSLVPGDANGTLDVFVRDRRTGTTELVSLGGRSAQANGPSSSPSISADGLSVAFSSEATNLVPRDTNGVVDIFVRRRWPQRDVPGQQY